MAVWRDPGSRSDRSDRPLGADDRPAHVRDEIERHLQSDAGNLIVEAAAELGDPALWPLLVELRDRGWQQADGRPEVLDWALETCRPATDGGAAESVGSA